MIFAYQWSCVNCDTTHWLQLYNACKLTTVSARCCLGYLKKTDIFCGALCPSEPCKLGAVTFRVGGLWCQEVSLDGGAAHGSSNWLPAGTRETKIVTVPSCSDWLGGGLYQYTIMRPKRQAAGISPQTARIGARTELQQHSQPQTPNKNNNFPHPAQDDENISSYAAERPPNRWITWLNVPKLSKRLYLCGI